MGAVTQSDENRAYWLAEAERRRRVALDPIAAASANRERARAAILPRGDAWIAQARQYEQEQTTRKGNGNAT